MDLKDLIRNYSLQNAVRYNGKASSGSVISKLLGEDSSLKKDMKNVSQTVKEMVENVNNMSLEDQTNELKERAPELLEKKEHKHDIFDFLKISEGAKVRTAFPPGPEKYPHIGHAKALLVNYLLAKKYNGEFILRFEDTNPELVKKEFYDIMQEDFKWLGVEWNELIYASDYMEIFYNHCKTLLTNGNAYVCKCSPDKIKESRFKGVPCECRDKDSEGNLNEWREMFSGEEGSAIVRLKIDLEHKNSTMRDPTIFRIIRKPHARLSSKHNVWPNYDFQNAIMDGENRITHRIRSKEFELRNELQGHIQALLGYKRTFITEFGRFNLEGVESSGRKIREMINNNELVGWDDPRLTTLSALRRRGFLPEAIRDFVVSTGITKNEAVLTWDDLILHNKRLLDKSAERYFAIVEPRDIKIENAPEQEIELNLNPNEKKGGRKFHTHEQFIIERRDFESIEEGELVRFIDCLNFRKEGDKFIFQSTEYSQFKGIGKKIIHWLPKNTNIPIKIKMPDAEDISCIAEDNIKKVGVEQHIQFERFGFCRLDSENSFWYTHK